MQGMARAMPDRRLAEDELLAAEERYRSVAEEQAALRRIATLVARAAATAEIFDAVAEEVARLFGFAWVGIMRYDSDELFTVVAQRRGDASGSPDTWGDLHPFPVGSRWPLDGAGITETVFRTGRTARIAAYAEVPGTAAEAARKAGIVGGVGAPIVVDGAVWGAIAAPSTPDRPIPEGAEVRLSLFTELVATAVSNAEARDGLRGLADEQAALRRVATLVAQGAAPSAVLDAVAGEMKTLLDADQVALNRFEPGAEIVVLAHRGLDVSRTPVGSRVSHEGENVTAIVRRTGQPARMDNYEAAGGRLAELARATGLRSSVSAPITVEGQVWGLITASWKSEESPPADTEERMAKFARLVDTAIANAAARAEVERLADEQASLRRIATLVAEGVQPRDLFRVVGEEVARVIDVPLVSVLRYDADNAVTLFPGFSAEGEGNPFGTRWSLEGTSAAKFVLASGEAVRIDDYSQLEGELADAAHRMGVRAVVAVPIVVGGRVWGTMIVSSTEAPLPEGTEVRLGGFTQLVATAIANVESSEALARLADEQAALRRVAELVAQEPSPDDVFTAVTEAVGSLLGADLAAMHVFPGEGTATTIAGWSASGPLLPIGTKLPLDGDSAAARIFQTGAAARIDNYVDVEGEAAEVARGLHLRSTVGAPILVDGKLWGALMAATRGEEPLPDDAEPRIAAFTALVATAISNAQAREDLRRLAEEQAALRRVATLVAQGVPAAELFSAVTREVERVFTGAEPVLTATVIRFDPGPEFVLAGASRPYEGEPIGSRWSPKELYVSTLVLRTGRSARVDEADLEALGGPDADRLRRRGFLYQVGCPIVVEGRLWGAMTLNSKEVLGPDTDRRLASFTELVGTAISNADSKSALTTSRRRIVAAADDARRKIERDLHDGAQQRLVSLGLELRAAEQLVPSEIPELRGELSRVAKDLESVVDDLREMSRGIHPAILNEGGLGPTLKTLARRSAIPVVVDVRADARFPEPIEVAAYYVAAEALTNAVRHAQASVVRVVAETRDDVLYLSIRDDGAGGADPARGSGLIGLRDRVEALGGSIDLSSPAGEGTLVVARFPLQRDGTPTEVALPVSES